MKNFLIWFHLFCLLCFFNARAASDSKESGLPNFKPVSDVEMSMDKVQKNRFAKRIEFINNIIIKIEKAFDSGDKKILSSEIPILGDECLNLFTVADLSEKKVKKIKKLGGKIDAKCSSFLKKIEDQTISQLNDRFGKIRAMVDEMLILCKDKE